MHLLSRSCADPLTQLALDDFLGQTIFGMDTSAMLHDVLDFLNFSEKSIEEQREQELWRTKEDCDTLEFDDELTGIQYRDQIADGIAYRFDVLLIQRVRYAALTSTITTIDWVMTALEKRLIERLPIKDGRTISTIKLLDGLCERARTKVLDTTSLELLVQVRNCLAHGAGLLNSYKYGMDLRNKLKHTSGIKVSNINFLGDTIEIEQGYLQTVREDALQWLPRLERSLHDAGALGSPQRSQCHWRPGQPWRGPTTR